MDIGGNDKMKGPNYVLVTKFGLDVVIYSLNSNSSRDVSITVLDE